MVLNVHRSHWGLLGTGRRVGWGYGGGGRGRLHTYHYTHHQNDSCIKMGSDESHFNVWVGSDGQSDKTVFTNHNLFEEKGEPKGYRTEVLPLTSLMSYHWAKLARLVVSKNVLLLCQLTRPIAEMKPRVRALADKSSVKQCLVWPPCGWLTKRC